MIAMIASQRSSAKVPVDAAVIEKFSATTRGASKDFDDQEPSAGSVGKYQD
jgi:hypothetical protein